MATSKRWPKILLFDIETAPIVASVWALWDQNVGVNQIEKDWHVLSWAAKWLGRKRMYYADQSQARNVTKDKPTLEGIWKLLDEADIVITQNGKAFDARKLNARFVQNGMKPPSPYKHIDIKIIAKRCFAFPSYSLEYMANALQLKTKKLKDHKFQGFELWRQCLEGNRSAWAEMRRYNCQDVRVLEAVYLKFQAWDQSIDFNVYAPENTMIRCNCGGVNLQRRGFRYTPAGKFQQYQCKDCGAWSAARGDSNNRLSKLRRAVLRGRA